ncbi:MAG: lysophospholipid acyltransferase family protein [Victivallaceae bacterium]|nr:lysophospholipid acyltransferase family protein [Victivallaceae bacterium]
MAMWRRIYRIVLLLAWMLIIWTFLIFTRWGEYWKVQRWMGKVSLVWGKVVAAVFGLKIKIVGNIGNFKGGLVVSNHTGYVDPLVHAAILPIRFAPKESIRKWPVIGWFFNTGRPIWIDRSSPQKSKLVEQQFRDSMTNGVPLLVYPEGTSTDGKSGLLEFKSTPFAAVAESDNWLLPTILRYGDTPDGKPIAWYGDVTLLPHLWRLLGYRQIVAEVTIMDPLKADGRDRKELARFVREKMLEQYKKTFQTAIRI